jgi:hypothetical protein
MQQTFAYVGPDTLIWLREQFDVDLPERPDALIGALLRVAVDVGALVLTMPMPPLTPAEARWLAFTYASHLFTPATDVIDATVGMAQMVRDAAGADVPEDVARELAEKIDSFTELERLVLYARLRYAIALFRGTNKRDPLPLDQAIVRARLVDPNG